VTARTRSIVAGALLVLTGAAGGIAVDHLVVFSRHMMHGSSPSGAAATHAALLGELDHALHLTPPQHDSIKAILTRHQRSIDSAWQLIHQHVNAGMDSVHQELGAVLRPEQLTLLHEWMSRQNMRMPTTP
jgi:hypothetical protein